MTVEIIHLPPNQWQHYRQIRLEALQTAPQAFTTTYAEMVDQPAAFWQERLAKVEAGAGNWLWFARSGERMVGMMGAYLPEGSSQAVIVSVYVAPEFRGTGVSRALMAALLSELGQMQGIRTLELSVTQGQAAALGLYKHFGFEIVQESEAAKGDGSAHIEYRMRRKNSGPGPA